jgi:hypothetical protein
MNKICTICNKNYPATIEYFYKSKLGKYGLDSECKECAKEKSKIFRNSKKGKMYLKKYKSSEKGIESNKRYNRSPKRKLANKKYNSSSKGKCWYEKYFQTDKGMQLHKEANKKYKKSIKGRISIRVENAKRRKKAYIELMENPFDKEEVIDWHHIDDKYVVALPKDIHELYGGYNHKENVFYIVKQIYGDL